MLLNRLLFKRILSKTLHLFDQPQLFLSWCFCETMLSPLLIWSIFDEENISQINSYMLCEDKHLWIGEWYSWRSPLKEGISLCLYLLSPENWQLWEKLQSLQLLTLDMNMQICREIGFINSGFMKLLWFFLDIIFVMILILFFSQESR